MLRRGMVLAAMALVAVIAGRVFAEDNGTVSGKVTVKGGKDACPKRTKLELSADPFCVTHHQGGPGLGSEDVICNADGTLRNVIVYVKEGLESKTYPPPAEPFVLDQKGCHYEPHIIVLQKGQPLHIKNSDETLHNIHGLPQKNAEFNIGQPKAGMVNTDVKLDQLETFKVKCEVHPWMGAYIMVLDHPYYGVTGKEGTFNLSKLPAGEYTIAAWHEVWGEQTQKVQLTGGETKEISFEFQPK